MAVNVKLVPMPRGCTKRVSSCALDPHGDFPDVPVVSMPFVNGEKEEMRGWLEGLASNGLQGRLDVLLHEGLFSLNGNLDIFEECTRHNLMLILEMMERRSIGLAHRYPKSHFRFTVQYKTEWISGEGGGEGSSDLE